MKTHWTWAALLGCALVAGCGDRQPETPQNLETEAPSVPPENAGVAGTGSAVPPAPSTPATSPRRDDSTVTATPGRASAAPAAGASSSAAPAATAPAAPRFREVTVPAGTALPLELMTALSSEAAKVETPVRARLRQALVVDGYTALPAGTVLNGNVVEVERAGRVQGRSRLVFRFTEAEFDGGRQELRTNPISFEGDETKGEDATKIGAGAVGGAIIGGILGGGSGAAKGAAIGGAAGTGVVLATRGREVSLGAGADLAATLASPFTVRAPAR